MREFDVLIVNAMHFSPHSHSLSRHIAYYYVNSFGLFALLHFVLFSHSNIIFFFLAFSFCCTLLGGNMCANI